MDAMCSNTWNDFMLTNDRSVGLMTLGPTQLSGGLWPRVRATLYIDVVVVTVVNALNIFLQLWRLSILLHLRIDCKSNSGAKCARNRDMPTRKV